MKLNFALVALIFFALLFDIEGRWRLSRFACPYRYGAKPYYFGKTNLLCMRRWSIKGKFKRSAPSRSTLSFSHRFIYYEGYYFEFGIGRANLAVYNRSATLSDRCRPRKEYFPAGYSTLSVDCLQRCTASYKLQYGRYNLFTNNCHHFANRMSEILCNYIDCPHWCW